MEQEPQKELDVEGILGVTDIQEELAGIGELLEEQESLMNMLPAFERESLLPRKDRRILKAKARKAAKKKRKAVNLAGGYTPEYTGKIEITKGLE